MKDNVDIWDYVLKKIGFEFHDEICGRLSNTNVLVFSKGAVISESKLIEEHKQARIFFNRDTNDVTLVSCTGETGPLNHSNSEFLIKHKDIFREAKLKSILT